MMDGPMSAKDWPVWTWKFAAQLGIGDEVEFGDVNNESGVLTGILSGEDGMLELLFVDQHPTGGLAYHRTVKPTAIFRVYPDEFKNLGGQ